jgi:hypothetical protein
MVQMLNSRRPQASFDNGQVLAFRRLLVNHNGADQGPATNADLYLANEISSQTESRTSRPQSTWGADDPRTCCRLVDLLPGNANARRAQVTTLAKGDHNASLKKWANKTLPAFKH